MAPPITLLSLAPQRLTTPFIAPWVRRLIIALSVVVGLLLLALLAFATVSARMRMRWRPAALRRVQLMAKRAKGPPREGRVTVVVTDIEGYSGG